MSQFTHFLRQYFGEQSCYKAILDFMQALYMPSQKTHFLVYWRLLVKGCIANIGLSSRNFCFILDYNDFLALDIFTRLALWADSVINSPGLYVCLFFRLFVCAIAKHPFPGVRETFGQRMYS